MKWPHSHSATNLVLPFLILRVQIVHSMVGLFYCGFISLHFQKTSSMKKIFILYVLIRKKKLKYKTLSK